VHDGFRVPAFDAAPSISCQTVKHTLLRLFLLYDHVRLFAGSSAQAAKSGVAVRFFINGFGFVFDRFGEKLEEFLRVLVLTGGEEEAALFAWYRDRERIYDGNGAKSTWG